MCSPALTSDIDDVNFFISVLFTQKARYRKRDIKNKRPPYSSCIPQKVYACHSTWLVTIFTSSKQFVHFRLSCAMICETIINTSKLECQKRDFLINSQFSSLSNKILCSNTSPYMKSTSHLPGTIYNNDIMYNLMISEMRNRM